MSFNLEVKEEIKSMKLWDVNSSMKQEEQIDRLNAREHFLSTGFINDPNKKSHIEILFKEEKKAKELQDVLKKYNFNFKIVARSNNYILYSKDGEEISNFLAFIGANKAVIKFEEVRVLKETRNNINRVINCENANLDKIIKSSVEQIEAIDYLIKTGELKKLDENLQEIALLRKKNPSISLEELGKLLKEPVGKSGANYRLKKIINIANEKKLLSKNS